MFDPMTGRYAIGMMTLEGSFRINGTTTPDNIKDFNTNLIKSVVRNGAGLFTVTFDDSPAFPYMPYELTIPLVTITASDSTPVKTVNVHVVDGSWNRTARSFQIATVLTGNAAAAVSAAIPADPDDNTQVAFSVSGSYLEVSKD